MPLKNIRRLSLLKCETNNEKIVGRDALIAPQRNVKQLTQTRKLSVGGTMTSIVPWRFAQCGTIEKSIAYLGWRAHNVRPYG
jgi:hypothetical protein